MPNVYRVLGQSDPGAAVLTDCYTVPALTQAVVSSIIICNRSAIDDSFRLSIAVAGAGDSLEQYIAYDVPIPGNDVVDFTIGATLGAADVVRVFSLNGSLSFNVFGEELS